MKRRRTDIAFEFPMKEFRMESNEVLISNARMILIYIYTRELLRKRETNRMLRTLSVERMKELFSNIKRRRRWRERS